MLRKVGQRLLDLDQNYADRIKSMYGMKDGAPTAEGLAAIAQSLGAGVGGGVSIKELLNDPSFNKAGRVGFGAINVGARYAAPTAGVAAAYHGIQALMPAEQTSGTLMP
jgi:hypothetical protein